MAFRLGIWEYIPKALQAIHCMSSRTESTDESTDE